MRAAPTFIRFAHAMRIVTDVFAWAGENLPEWNTISISGYHMREAGSTAAQEVAFTLANGITYVQAAIDAGLDIDHFAPRLSFFFNAHNNFLEEVAKFRAARRIWAGIMRDRFRAKNPRSWMLRFHTQTAGSTLTAQQPENNIVRTALQAMAAVLGGTQSLHTNGYDEALALPTEEAARIALRTQQIIASRIRRRQHHRPRRRLVRDRVADQPDRAAGSGLLRPDRKTRRNAGRPSSAAGCSRKSRTPPTKYQRAVDTGEATVVGVNRFTREDDPPIPTQHIDEALETQAGRARPRPARPP